MNYLDIDLQLSDQETSMFDLTSDQDQQQGEGRSTLVVFEGQETMV